MSSVFADTSYFLALLNPADVDHARARTMSTNRTQVMVTTSAVLMELANALCNHAVRSRFILTLESLRRRGVNIVDVDATLFNDGVEYFRQRQDKDWSLTDCVSFIVMHRLGITDALSADNHFWQAGFRALLLD